MSEPPEYLSEAEAARLWKRAAEMQASAAGRDAAPDDEDDPAPRPPGYALEHVRAAALEAGIEDEFLHAALTELRAERALPAAPGGVVGRTSRAFLGSTPDFIEARRVIDATPEQVLAAMERVFPRAPYNLVFKDRVGPVLEGGVVSFEIQGASFVAHEGWVGEASWADMREVFASLREVPGTRPSCELTLRSPVAWARPHNLGLGAFLTTMGGGMGMGIGTAAGGSLAGAVGAGVLAALIASGAVAAGAAGGAGFVWAGYRWLYRHGLRTGERSLATLLGAVATEAQGGWGVASARERNRVDSGPERALPAGGDTTGD